MVYNTQNDHVFGLCQSSGILNTRKHNVSETGTVSVLRRGEYIHTVGSIERANLNNWTIDDKVKSEVKVILGPTVGRPVCPVVRPQSGPVTNSFLLEIFLRQLWVCYFMAPSLMRGQLCNLLLLLGFASTVPLGSDSHGIQDHILLSHFLRLPKPGVRGLRIYIPQGQGGTVIPRALGLTSLSKSKLLYDLRSVCQSVSMFWCRAHSGTCDQILLLVWRLLSESCCFVSMGRPLWREDGSSVCGAIIKWSVSRRTRNHTLLSHLRLPQPGEPDFRIYIPQEQGGPVISPGTGFPLNHLLRAAGLQWRYFNPRPHEETSLWYKTSYSYESSWHY
jgi:hypothetical protein